MDYKIGQRLKLSEAGREHFSGHTVIMSQGRGTRVRGTYKGKGKTGIIVHRDGRKEADSFAAWMWEAE